jgi:hypothetical protein
LKAPRLFAPGRTALGIDPDTLKISCRIDLRYTVERAYNLSNGATPRPIPIKKRVKNMKDLNKELTKFITKVLVSEGYESSAVSYVLGEYDLVSYLLEDSLKVIKEQVTDIAKVMEI